jgi:hypothetical protein
MAASLDRQAFGAGVLAGAAAAGLAAYCYSSRSQHQTSSISIQQLPQQQQQQQQKAQASASAHHASLQEFEQDEILAEQLTRNVQFFGLEHQKQITNAFVVVIGLGVRAGCWKHSQAGQLGWLQPSAGRTIL